VLTLPKNIRETLNLSEGNVFSVTQVGATIVLERPLGDVALLKDIRQSLTEIKNGKYIEFGSIKEFKKKLSYYTD
jgi:bifunctional DNA-binding transcriptional regulator/antitoxin component of YhaV-PrlF toxin-antitoxin module